MTHPYVILFLFISSVSSGAQETFPQIALPPTGNIPIPAPQVLNKAALFFAGTIFSPKNVLIKPISAVSLVSPKMRWELQKNVLCVYKTVRDPLGMSEVIQLCLHGVLYVFLKQKEFCFSPHLHHMQKYIKSFFHGPHGLKFCKYTVIKKKVASISQEALHWRIF